MNKLLICTFYILVLLLYSVRDSTLLKSNFSTIECMYKIGLYKVQTIRVQKSSHCSSDKPFFHFHASDTGAHCVQLKTRDVLSQRYYCPGMSKDMEKWVCLCDLFILWLYRNIKYKTRILHAETFSCFYRCHNAQFARKTKNRKTVQTNQSKFCTYNITTITLVYHRHHSISYGFLFWVLEASV